MSEYHGEEEVRYLDDTVSENKPTDREEMEEWWRKLCAMRLGDDDEWIILVDRSPWYEGDFYERVKELER